MTLSGVEPAERWLSFVPWGLAALGLIAALVSPLMLKVDRALAQQAVGDVKTASSSGEAAAAFSVKVIKQASDQFKIKGLVATEEDRKALLGLVKASFPSADVNDRIKIAAGQRKDIKLGGISFALKALSYLRAGSARIDEHGVTLTGETENAAAYIEFKSFVASPPTGVLVKQDEVSRPPAGSSWRAEVSDGKVRLSGTVAETADKRELEAKVHKLFSGLEIVDETSVDGGASESWLDAALHSLQVLRLLDSGFVQLGDHKIQLYGHASDESKLRKIDSLAGGYPNGFALDSNVSAPMQANILSIPSFSASERLPLSGISPGSVGTTR